MGTRTDEEQVRKAEEHAEPQDLERCPRCGFVVEEIRWGQTDCPNCGLHFECC